MPLYQSEPYQSATLLQWQQPGKQACPSGLNSFSTRADRRGFEWRASWAEKFLTLLLKTAQAKPFCFVYVASITHCCQRRMRSVHQIIDYYHEKIIESSLHFDGIGQIFSIHQFCKIWQYYTANMIFCCLSHSRHVVYRHSSIYTVNVGTHKKPREEKTA